MGGGWRGQRLSPAAYKHRAYVNHDTVLFNSTFRQLLLLTTMTGNMRKLKHIPRNLILYIPQ